MKALVTGAEGLLGKKLVEILNKNKIEFFGTCYEEILKGKNYQYLDITNKNEVDKTLNRIKPDLIIHTAAFTDVDGCEKNKKVAFKVNVSGTQNLAVSAEKLNIKFVHISTDYVFDGKKGYYTENDTTNPISYYGETKLESEKVVEKICSNFIIARTSVIYGSNKKNFVKWVIEKLKNKDTINIITDQYVSPTLNTDLSEQLIALIKKDAKGIYHTAGGERISRYDFTLKIADFFNLDKINIKPSKMSSINWLAKRPVDSSLNISKVSEFKKPYKVEEALVFLERDLRGDSLII